MAKINHITLTASDKKRAEEFYTNILGFEKIEQGNSLWIKIGSQFIHLTEDNQHLHQECFNHFAIEIENIQNFLNNLVNKGVEVFNFNENNEKIKVDFNNLSSNQQYFINDPDENLIEFIEKDNLFFNPKV